VADPLDPSQLVGRWTHAHEEDQGGAFVLRPVDAPLPPSRGRRSLELEPGGTLVEGRPGADDRSVGASGSWSLDGGQLVLSVSGRPEEHWQVESVEPDRLVLRPAGEEEK
jgi:hypothetical protein